MRLRAFFRAVIVGSGLPLTLAVPASAHKSERHYYGKPARNIIITVGAKRSECGRPTQPLTSTPSAVECTSVCPTRTGASAGSADSLPEHVGPWRPGRAPVPFPPRPIPVGYVVVFSHPLSLSLIPVPTATGNRPLGRVPCWPGSDIASASNIPSDRVRFLPAATGFNRCHTRQRREVSGGWRRLLWQSL